MERRVSELVGVNPWAFGLVFNKLARGTFAHKVSNVMAHVGPMKASLKTMDGLSETHMPTKSSFMVAWKVDGALHRPNGMTLYS